MREDLTLTGMVISAIPIGEYDKRLILLTRERGKIHAFARSARRQNSQLLACSQPFTFGQFSVYEGKSAYNLVGAQVENYFLELRQDLELVCYGSYFLELAEYFAKENLDATEELKLLYQSFRALIRRSQALSAPLIRYIFEWKILAVEGLMPQMFECVGCGQDLERGSGNSGLFSCRAGGLVCSQCKSRYPDAIPISPAAVYTLQYIGASTIAKLYTFTLKEETVKELGRLAKHYYGLYVDKTFHSLELL